MEIKVTLPKIGKTMSTATITSWHKKPGDTIADGDVLFVMNNGKNEFEIEATVSGVLKNIIIGSGKTVPVATEIAVIEAKSVASSAKRPSLSEEKIVSSANPVSVIVIGGGPGGYVSAIRAAQLGAKVTLIEQHKIGGTCLNCGCMPTKALMHSAEIYDESRNSENAGIIANDVSFDWKKVQDYRSTISEKLTGGVKALIKANKITLIEGSARFVGNKIVEVNGKEISGDKIIIASGSQPIIPAIPGLSESKACIDSSACLELDHVPESMLVIGGGVIGLELGSIYSRFGSKVTVIEMTEKLLPLMEEELTALLAEQLRSKGIDIFTGSKVLSVSDTETGALIKVLCPDGEKEFYAEKVLVCIGRSPNTQELCVEKTGISTQSGFIPANDKLETEIPGIYAVGDCNGKLMLAHAAMAMGEIAAENAMGGNLSFCPSDSPSCAFVGPEFAGVGITEKQAKERGLAYKVGKFPMNSNGKSLVMGHTNGMIKVIAGEKYGEIMGVHILGARATDLIAEAALAIKLEATLDEIAGTIHCHPTIAEALRECVLNVDNKAIHTTNKRKKI